MRKRAENAGETRGAILAAARRLLLSEGLQGFRVEDVARDAGVTRPTVYNQLGGGKRALLEALYDDLAARGGAARMAQAKDTDAFVEACCSFWAHDAPLLRRLVALAGVDTDASRALAARERRRRASAERLVLSRHHATLLFALTSFGFWDALRPLGDDATVLAEIRRLTRPLRDR